MEGLRKKYRENLTQSTKSMRGYAKIFQIQYTTS